MNRYEFSLAERFANGDTFGRRAQDPLSSNRHQRDESGIRMDESHSPDYEFAGFRLNTAQQMLSCPSGNLIALQSRVFATLRYLVERSGEIVEKSALMSAVWPSTVVAENNLNQCVSKLRKVLGEAAGDRQFILTVPGRGFKFVAPVRVVPREPHSLRVGLAPTPPIPPAPVPAPPAPLGKPADPPTSPRWRWLAAGVLACLAAVTVWIVVHTGSAPHSIGSPAEFQPLTDLTDSATAPVLSSDGRTLAFIRHGHWMPSPGQIWLRVLPDGEYRQLTHESEPLFAPAFTPDGTRVTFSVVAAHMQSWDTWTVPVSGGEPTKLLPNASGLSYIGPHQVMFSEFKTGVHLGIATASEERRDYRAIYWSAHERAMAHFSHLSPDRKSVLVVEMNGTGNFDRCRLVPFSGGNGTPVGPIGECLAAAWSADGKWMFFSASVAGHSHLWRQQLGQGDAEQMTFGPTDEETVFATPDGHSLLTAIGAQQDTLWFHDTSGDRVLTTEGHAFSPWLPPDARHVYFLSATNSQTNLSLSRVDVTSGVHEALLPEFNVASFDVTSDEQQVVFATVRDGVSELWLAPLDRHSPPKLLVRGADQPQFGGGGVFFRSLGTNANYLHRINLDGSHETAVLPTPIVRFQAVAPDGRFVVVDHAQSGPAASAWLIAVRNQDWHLLGQGWLSLQVSRDGKLLYFGIEPTDAAHSNARTGVLHLDADGLPGAQEIAAASTAATIPQSIESLSAGQDPSVYAYVKSEVRRNIYRIPLH
jgi:DNA-binding winged helix-turn-helix (wHTH) protein/Tol biopolymer transport system component